MLKRIQFFILVLLASCLQASVSTGTDEMVITPPAMEKKSFTIGIVSDGTTISDIEMVRLFRENIVSLSEDDFKVSFPARYILSGQDSKEGVRRAFRTLLAGKKPDIILAIGLISSAVALEMKLSKPVIAPYVPQFALSGKRPRGYASGIRNLTYIDYMFYLDNDLEEFRKVVSFKRLAMVFDRRDIDAVPDKDRLVRAFEKKHDIAVDIVPAGSSASAVMQAIPDSVDAVMVGPLWHFDNRGIRELAAGLIERKLPSFALWDRKQVEAGLFAGLDSKEKLEILARRTAVAALDIMSGDRPDSVEVQFTRSRRMTINMATARALERYPSLLMMTGADIINDEPSDIVRTLDIKTAVEEAVESNLRLQSARKRVEAGRYSVRESMSPLLPQIDIHTGLQAIDQDRARAGGGINPERAWTGGAGGSILLYSEQKWADYTSEKHLQAARKEAENVVRLNIIYDTSVAYLKLLRARAIERIYKDNLKLTEANLERAQTRVATGAAGPDEVYRWETKFASDRQLVLYRESDTMDAMEAVNRLLHKPLQERFMPEETNLSDPLFIMGDSFFTKLMDNPYYLKKFKRFAIKKAIELRPELKSYDAAIKAKERQRSAAKRRYWLPDFSIDWSVEQYLAQDGSGQRDGTPLDDTDWNVGLFVRFPLFEGGRTAARTGRLQEEVARLHIQKGNQAEAVIQNVLSAINRTRASYPSIYLSRDAAEAAKRNLDLVTSAYINGIKSIIDLLDAQNQSLNADLAATDAVYNFLIDFMGVERAIGEFVTFMPEEQRNLWIQKAKPEIFE